jgi:hypothetical protein
MLYYTEQCPWAIYIQLVIQSAEARRRLIGRLLLSGAWGYHGNDVVLTELMTKMKPSPL